jgi:DNA-directed RNA polymerase subunit RPC12/RpoP
MNKEDLNEEIQCTTCNCSITRGQLVAHDKRFCENCWEPEVDENDEEIQCPTCNSSIIRGQLVAHDKRFCENCWEPEHDTDDEDSDDE